MNRVLFDIETVGIDFDHLDESSQEYLLRYAKDEERKGQLKELTSIYPLISQIVSIGILDLDTNKGGVYYQSEQNIISPYEEDNIIFRTGSEKEILEKFWSIIKDCQQFITFNGRAFDCPFIIVRSAINKIKPLRNLMPNRYSDEHIDLMDQLTFYGAMKRFSLEMWCNALKIENPKDGISGKDVKALFKERKYIEIAKYCSKDIKATKKLFDIWKEYIKFERS